MKFKVLFRILLISILVFLIADVFGRAGGGSSSGGGHSSGGGGHSGGRPYSGYPYSSHGYYGNSYNNDSSGSVGVTLLIIITVVTALVFGTIPALIKLKSHLSAKIITRASNKDSVWEADALKKHTEKIFYKMQRAWENRNMERVKKHVTAKLYADYTVLLTEMLKNREKNILSFITIDEITIIGCEDYKDDSKDRYIAYIKGSMLDYTIKERSKKVIQNPNRETAPFSDTYHFVRSYNTWLLEKINNTVRIQDIIETKNSMEV